MSADLLAEFDSFYQPPATKQQTSTSTAFDDLTSLGSSTQTSQIHNRQKQSQWQTPQDPPKEDVWGQISAFQPGNTQPPSQSQPDIWESFESKPDSTRYAAPQPSNSVGPRQTKPAILRRDTLEMFSSQQVDGWGSSGSRNQNDNQKSRPLSSIPASASAQKTTFNGDVLFDADNLSEEDEDFGDFEEATPVIPNGLQQQPSSGAKDLEDMFDTMAVEDVKQSRRPAQLSPVSPNSDSAELPYPQAPKSPSFQERNPFADLGVSIGQVSKLKSQTREGSPVTPWPTFAPPVPEPYQDSPAPTSKLDDDWGDFEETPGEEPVSFAKPSSGIEADAWAWDAADGVTENQGISKEIVHTPPTNIPPPSVLLPLLMTLFDLPKSALFQPIDSQPASLKQRILGDPSTIDFLRAYLLIAKVAAYVIAGRKPRWKRDTLLSQAMKIGPAAAGGKGGMKLAGVDRAEVVREDREVADTVRVWKEQLGKLKSAVAIANASIQVANDQLVIPDIQETMHVKVQEGALSAPKQCVICGLKREERVSKVDVNVEDSFGEWWTEHWGHRSCKNFWLEHESKLKQR